MVALETFVAIVVCGFGAFLAWLGFGAWIVTHARTVACVFLATLALLFVAALALNGASFTGANLHPAPPPIATDAPDVSATPS